MSRDDLGGCNGWKQRFYGEWYLTERPSTFVALALVVLSHTLILMSRNL